MRAAPAAARSIFTRKPWQSRTKDAKKRPAKITDRYVRHVLRLPVSLSGGVVRTARRQYDVARQAMGAKTLYARFERDGRTRLNCVFGLKPGPLFAETLRNAMRERKGVEHSYVWCEPFGEEYGLVYVRDGQIMHESFETDESLPAAILPLVRRAQRRESEEVAPLYLNRVSPDELGLDPTTQFETPPDSVCAKTRSGKTKGSPSLIRYDRSIRRIASGRLMFRAMLWGLATIPIIPATWLITQWQYDDPPAEYSAENERMRLDREQYNRLLQHPDTKVLFPALYQISRDMLNVFWKTGPWSISSLVYTRDGPLQLTLAWPDVPDPLGNPAYIPRGLEEQLRRSADEHGWTMEVQGLSIILSASASVPQRSQEEALKLHLHHPEDLLNERWGAKRLAQDLMPLGDVQVNPDPVHETELYYTQGATLNLQSIPWHSSSSFLWLGQRLSGGPVVVDELRLRPAEGSMGGTLSGTLRFRLVWHAR